MMGNEGEDWAKKCVRMRERFPEATEIRPLYCEGEVLLAEIDGALWLSEGETLCMITSHPYEPCTYLKLRDGAELTIHNAFEVRTIKSLATNGGTVSSVTGNVHDLPGLCGLLLYAARLGGGSFDVGYLEARMIAGELARCGAVSADTAMDIAVFGVRNRNVMNGLVHGKRVGRTPDGRFFVRKRG